MNIIANNTSTQQSPATAIAFILAYFSIMSHQQ